MSGRAGFSLVEMMVAVTLLLVIIVGLLAVFYQTQRAFRAGMTQVDVLEAGRATTELLASELQEATALPEFSATSFKATRPEVADVVQLDLPGGEKFTPTLQNISFIRRINDRWIGESYQVSNNFPGVAALYRLSVDVYAKADVPALAANLLAWRVQDGKRKFEKVADGLLHFRVIPFDAAGLPLIGDPSITNGANTVIHTGANPGCEFFNDGLPSTVELELAVLEPAALEQLRAKNGNLAYLNRQANRIHFFKRRINLPNAPKSLYVTNSP